MYWISCRTWIKLIIIVLILILPTNVNSGITDKLPVDSFKSSYDDIFRKSTKRYFGIGFDYRQFKSQGVAESNLRERAISSVGAKGIMQIMDFTQKEQSEGGSVYDPKWNIPTGIKYDKKLYDQWSSPRPFNDRMAFTFASYNGGLGNPLKAQKICLAAKKEDCNLQNNVISYGGDVKSQRHEESEMYVLRIMHYMNAETTEVNVVDNYIIDQSKQITLNIEETKQENVNTTQFSKMVEFFL